MSSYRIVVRESCSRATLGRISPLVRRTGRGLVHVEGRFADDDEVLGVLAKLRHDGVELVSVMPLLG
jgi:hypothetical protein